MGPDLQDKIERYRYVPSHYISAYMAYQFIRFKHFQHNEAPNKMVDLWQTTFFNLLLQVIYVSCQQAQSSTGNTSPWNGLAPNRYKLLHKPMVTKIPYVRR